MYEAALLSLKGRPSLQPHAEAINGSLTSSALITLIDGDGDLVLLSELYSLLAGAGAEPSLQRLSFSGFCTGTTLSGASVIAINGTYYNRDSQQSHKENDLANFVSLADAKLITLATASMLPGLIIIAYSSPPSIQSLLQLLSSAALLAGHATTTRLPAQIMVAHVTSRLGCTVRNLLVPESIYHPTAAMRNETLVQRRRYRQQLKEFYACGTIPLVISSHAAELLGNPLLQSWLAVPGPGHAPSLSPAAAAARVRLCSRCLSVSRRTISRLDQEWSQRQEHIIVQRHFYSLLRTLSSRGQLLTTTAVACAYQRALGMLSRLYCHARGGRASNIAGNDAPTAAGRLEDAYHQLMALAKQQEKALERSSTDSAAQNVGMPEAPAAAASPSSGANSSSAFFFGVFSPDRFGRRLAHQTVRPTDPGGTPRQSYPGMGDAPPLLPYPPVDGYLHHLYRRGVQALEEAVPSQYLFWVTGPGAGFILIVIVFILSSWYLRRVDHK